MNTSPGSKVITSSAPSMLRATVKNGENSGPTGSKRSYPKGKGGASANTASWNPMHSKASTYGLNGA